MQRLRNLRGRVPADFHFDRLVLPWSEITDLLQAVKATCRIVPLTVETHAQAVRLAQQLHIPANVG